MSDDWKPGDEAWCIQGSQYERVGAKYTVKAVSHYGDWCEGAVHADKGVTALRFVEVAHKRLDWSDAARFRKIRPHTPDAEDAEVIALLNGAGVKEGV